MPVRGELSPFRGGGVLNGNGSNTVSYIGLGWVVMFGLNVMLVYNKQIAQRGQTVLKCSCVFV